MPVEVVVRIPPRMFREDVAALRDWLNLTYPVGWVERADPTRGDSLATGDLLFAAVFTGVGEAVGKAALDLIRQKIAEFTKNHSPHERVTVDTEELVQPETGEPADEIEPVGPDDDGQ